MTDQQPADLRDRIAQAIADVDAENWGTPAPPTGHPLWRVYRAHADAVLAVLPVPADRAAVLWEAADAIEAEQQRLDDEDSERRVGQSMIAATIERGAVNRAAKYLRRAADDAQQPETQADDRAAIIAEVLPAWEAVYEPGNVSDYLVGYANDEAPAKAAAEAWLRSQAEVTGRLEWVPDERQSVGEYEQWFELVERHDDSIDTGPGLIVRRRMATEAQQMREGGVDVLIPQYPTQ